MEERSFQLKPIRCLSSYMFLSACVFIGSYSFSNEAQANTVVFNPRTHTWAAINDNGRVVSGGRASGGRGFCPDTHRACRTPTGTFRVHSIGGAGCKSGKYPVGEGGAPMPYCMYFSKYYALHGSYEVPRGRNASHGCIRVTPAAAKWLSHNFVHVGTRVVVKSY